MDSPSWLLEINWDIKKKKKLFYKSDLAMKAAINNINKNIKQKLQNSFALFIAS